MNWILENKDALIVGLLFLVIGIPITVLITRKHAARKKLTYSIKNNTVIKDLASSYEGLEVKFKGQNVRNLTSTIITLKNSGNTTIDKGDIIPKDHFRIEVQKGISIFDYSVVKPTIEANDFLLSRDGNKINIDFDYIDKKQSCAIQVLHSGVFDDNISIKGGLKGTKILIPKHYNWNSPYVLYAILSSIIVALFFGVEQIVIALMSIAFIVTAVSVVLTGIELYKEKSFIRNRFDKQKEFLEKIIGKKR